MEAMKRFEEWRRKEGRKEKEKDRIEIRRVGKRDENEYIFKSVTNVYPDKD